MIEPRDDGEVAQDYQARHNQDAIEKVVAEARRPGRTLVIPVCEDCCGVIPKDRLKACSHATRCLECQKVYERLREGL